MAAPRESLRRRKAGAGDPEPEAPPGQGRDLKGRPARLRAGTFWLTRIVLLRALAFVYFVAFLVAFHQNKQLIGDRGLLPCRAYLQSVQRHFGGRVSWDALSYAPTILWLLDWSHMDANLDALALLGLGISSFILVSGCANMVLMAALWVLYMSLVNVGQIWYSFGWESQLLETGFLGIFLCPLWTLSALPRGTPTSRVVMWGFRWLIFRIMLGAGLIKIRGDRCWQDLTCMDFHYETQPVPNPVAYFLHRSPWWFHRFETLSNHFLELVVPFFIFLGRRMCIVHGALQVLFQERAEDVSTRTSSHAQFAQLFRKVLRVLQRQPVVYMGRRTTSTSDPHALPRRDPARPVVSFCCGPSRTSYPDVNQARGSWSTQSHIPDSRPYLPPRPAFSKLHDISHSPRNIAVGTSLQLWAQRAAPTSLSDLSTSGVTVQLPGASGHRISPTSTHPSLRGNSWAQGHTSQFIFPLAPGTGSWPACAGQGCHDSLLSPWGSRCHVRNRPPSPNALVNLILWVRPPSWAHSEVTGRGVSGPRGPTEAGLGWES